MPEFLWFESWGQHPAQDGLVLTRSLWSSRLEPEYDFNCPWVNRAAQPQIQLFYSGFELLAACCQQPFRRTVADACETLSLDFVREDATLLMRSGGDQPTDNC